MLLHEGLGSVGLWREFPAALQAATGCGVLAYSRFGYGRSDGVELPRPLSYMHDEARDVLGRVLDAAGIGGACWWDIPMAGRLRRSMPGRCMILAWLGWR